jgi:hypothetical protein
LFISLKSQDRWEGKIFFDQPRHKKYLKLPMDYARINQFPEWYTIKSEKQYEIKNLITNSTQKFYGFDLEKGFSIELDPNLEHKLKLTEI